MLLITHLKKKKNPVQGHEGLEPVPACIGNEAGYTPWMSGQIEHIHTATHTLQTGGKQSARKKPTQAQGEHANHMIKVV